MNNTKKHGYLILPIELLNEPYNLTPITTMLFCLIASLSKTKPCFASNEYIATKLNTSPRTIQRAIPILINQQLVQRSIKHLSKDKKQRLLSITPTGRKIITAQSFAILND